MAALYVKQAMDEKDKQAKNDLFGKATAKYNEADHIDIHEATTWLGKGRIPLRCPYCIYVSPFSDHGMKASCCLREVTMTARCFSSTRFSRRNQTTYQRFLGRLLLHTSRKTTRPACLFIERLCRCCQPEVPPCVLLSQCVCSSSNRQAQLKRLLLVR